MSATSAKFSVKINHEEFAYTGYQAGFNEEKCAALLDEVVPGSLESPLSIVVRPQPLWLAVCRGKRLGTLLKFPFKPEYSHDGSYNSKQQLIKIWARWDDESNNNTLLHEVRHWADDVLDLSKPRSARLKLSLAALSIAGGLATGYTAAVEGGWPMVLSELAGGAIALGGQAAAHKITYTNDPHEIRAREFAEDPNMVARYGGIISCTPVQDPA